jgi:hypothetical protein
VQRLPTAKLAGQGYGLLTKLEVRIAPWEEVDINLIGPWKVKVNGRQVEFYALTCIDAAWNSVELIRVDNKTAKHIHDKFTQSLFCQYLCPVQCLHDKEVNSSDRTFNSYWQSLALRTYAQPAKIHNLMQSMKGCIRE